MRIKTRHPGEYWSYALGSATILGDSSDVLYVSHTGPGGVCCSQIQLFDVSRNTPRVIFNSEDFGLFRDWTEIFDAEGDGVFELAKWDSCFRYFMGACGSCSPEPKAVFKYDRKESKYLPAKGVQQDFAKLYLQRDEQWIIEQHRLWKDGKLETWLDLDRAVLKHVVDLLWLGEEDRAWSFYDQYMVWEKEKVKKAMQETLKDCPYYRLFESSHDALREGLSKLSYRRTSLVILTQTVNTSAPLNLES